MNNNYLIETLFEDKNKNYGAYALRKNYDDNMAKSMFLAFFLMTSLLLWGYMSTHNDVQTILDNVTTVVLSNEKVEEVKVEKAKIAEPKPKLTPKLSEAKSIAFVEPKVVVDDPKKNTVDLPTMDSVHTGIISNKDNAGTGGSVVQNALPNDGNGDQGNGSEAGETTKVIIPNTPTVNPDVSPEFPGGMVALRKFLSENMKYPSIARENNVSGRVALRFVVSKTGEISKIVALSKHGYGLEEEACRVVKLMPLWRPGLMNKKAVDVTFILPISFNLER